MKIYKSLDHWIVAWIDSQGRIHAPRFNSYEEAQEYVDHAHIRTMKGK